MAGMIYKKSQNANKSITADYKLLYIFDICICFPIRL